jgi:hypothetical protein
MKWPCHTVKQWIKKMVLGRDCDGIAENIHQQVRAAVHEVRNKVAVAQAVVERSVQVSHRTQAIAEDAIARLENARSDEHE